MSATIAEKIKKIAYTVPLLGAVAWLVPNFLQLRGLVNLLLSRVDLAAIAACLFFGGWIWTRQVQQKYKWRILFGVVALLLYFTVDWLTPKPPEAQIHESDGTSSQYVIIPPAETKSREKPSTAPRSQKIPKSVTEPPLVMMTPGVLPPDIRDKATQPTLWDMFESDFPTLPKANDHKDAAVITWRGGGKTKVKRQIYLDFEANTQFVGFYIPSAVPSSADTFSGKETVTACVELLRHNAIQEALADLHKQHGGVAVTQGQETKLDDLIFSGRVYIFHEDYLSPQQVAEVISLFKINHLSVQLNGPSYLAEVIDRWHREHERK